MRTGQPKSPTPKPASRESRLKKALRTTYEINGLLGTGGMGNVYLATHRQLGSKVAIKVLSEELSSETVIIGRFLNEAKIEANLQHPNIVRVFDVKKQGGLHYFVMDYIEGEDLAERIQRLSRPFPTLEAINIGLQVLKALEHAHEHGIIHRDLKPSNVRIDKHGTAIVMDFGIAHARNASESCKTMLGQTLGTPLYMSPEQIKGLPLDNRSDLYSAAVILHEVLSGNNFFAADSVHAIYSKHLYEIPPSLSTVRSDVSPRLSAVIEKALAKEVDTRYVTAGGMIEELQAIADDTVPALTASYYLSGQSKAVRAQSPVPATIAEASLPDEDRKLLGLIDGRRTIAQLQQISQLDTQDLYRRLAALEEKNAVKAHIEGSSPDKPGGLETDKVSDDADGWLGRVKRYARTIRLPRLHLSRAAWLSLGAIAVALCLLAVFLIRAEKHQSPPKFGPAQFDAAPFALVTLMTPTGQILAKQETPFCWPLSPGKYVARFEFRGQERIRHIEVREGGSDLFREEFWGSEQIRQLLERYGQR